VRPLVLLVDNDTDTREMYAEFLRLHGFDVRATGNGREALAAVSSDRPAIVITEMRLPGIDGLSLCRQLRQEAATAALPILVVTADAFAHQVELARQGGADEVLIKPCLPDDLLEAVQRLLGHGASGVRLRTPNLHG